MNYLEYQLDYGEMDIYFESVPRCIRAKDKKTRKDISLSNRDALAVILHLHILEAYEREGHHSEPRGISIELEEGIRKDLPNMIMTLREMYDFEDISVFDPLTKRVMDVELRNPIPVTRFPEGWQTCSNDEFNELMYDWLKGRLAYSRTEI